MMKINLILLASGNSTRFKGNKLLALVNDKPMYMNVIEKILKLNFNKIILVTQYEEIRTALFEQPIQVVMNNNSEIGISQSIKLGIESDMEADAYMFMVCDQPFISTDTIQSLVDRFVQSGKGMACVQYKERLGNPTIFSKKYKDELLSLKGDVGGKAVMKKYMNDLELVQVTKKIELMDIDNKESFNKLRVMRL